MRGITTLFIRSHWATGEGKSDRARPMPEPAPVTMAVLFSNNILTTSFTREVARCGDFSNDDDFDSALSQNCYHLFWHADVGNHPVDLIKGPDH